MSTGYETLTRYICLCLFHAGTQEGWINSPTHSYTQHYMQVSDQSYTLRLNYPQEEHSGTYWAGGRV